MVKTCCHCGKDVTGHTRFRDSRGYWCKACHQADKAALGEEKCRSCGRTFSAERLIDIDGKKYCATCDKERQKKMMANLRRQAAKKGYWQHEWRGVLRVLIILAILGAIILLSWLKLL
jgi:hypothetical protein